MKYLWLQRYRIDVVLALVILFVALLPRVVDLGTFLTADEKNWIGRSYEFIRAFKDWRFNDMLQTTHPGVTTMWVSGVAVTARMMFSHIPFSFQNLVYFVTAAQLPIALINAIAVPIMYAFLLILWRRRWLAFVAAMFIALNPFLIGYSRLVHVDGMLTSFIWLAALATIIYARSGFSRKWLLISSVLAGLAILTKVPAVFLAPYLGLVILVSKPGGIIWKEYIKERARDFVLWLIVVGLLFVILWPSVLWVNNPQGNALVLKRDIVEATITPHNMTESYTLNFWHYPMTLLTRTTPVILVLAVVLLGGLLVGLFRQLRGELGKRRGNYSIEWLLFAYIFFFVVMMMLGAKKGDRYVLPVFPAIDVLAAAGLMMVVMKIKQIKYTVDVKKVFVVLSVLVMLFLGGTVYWYHPYNIAYSSPLFADNLSQELGWGEGLEQVGAWLSENAPEAVVASWYPEELGAYTSAHVAHINAHEQGKVRYIVLYRNMFGRAPDHYANDFIDEYYKKRLPVFTAVVAGKEFAWVFEKGSYERVVGELVQGVRVGQEIKVSNEKLVGLDVLVATYSGEASSGELIIELKEKQGGKIIHEWQVSVAEIKNDRWLTVLLPELFDLSGEKLFVEVYAKGVVSGKAPTVRYTRDHNYRESSMFISRTGIINDSDVKEGDLAVRLRYEVDGQVATEEDTRLLK